ncbi:uncharacterized protein LOC116124793 [Pistacia vera]|uniref:uncharacterized protein LOC116124793 n=1 Tax=Pistacia vera TaxID=55513 RepID=UPI0012639F34|nr:uncharacterized protein LOC116124793 [Pistacia vera]
MKSKPIAIRAFGQRSIASTLLYRSSNPFKNTEGDVNDKLAAQKASSVSLSDFLDRKLHKSSVQPKTIQGKSSPFSTPVGLRNAGGNTDGQMGIKKEVEEEVKNVLDKEILEQFKHTGNEKGEAMGSCSVGEVEISNVDNVKESKKRRNPFEDAFSSKKPIISGADEKHTTRKPFVVLGDDSKWNRKGREKSSISNKKPRPSYNHYANGRGWWDCDMEGVDDEEVGFGQVWEGVGSTTFGGIEWH